MKRYKELIGAAAVSMVVAAAAAGCSGGSHAALSDTSNGIDNSKFVTVSMYNFGDPTNDSWQAVQQAMNDYIKQNTNLNCAIELHFMTWTNWQTNYATMFASGQPVDLVNTASDWLNMWEYARKGAFLDLTSLMPKYAPEYYAQVPLNIWNACKFNGQIICLPEYDYTQWVNHGFMYRNDWVQQSGITDGIHTWDQMTQYFQWILDNKPGVTPWDVAGGQIEHVDGWLNSFSTTIPLSVGTSDVATWSIKSPTDLTVTCPFTDPAYNASLIQFAQTMQQWDSMGVWKTDVMNNADDTWQTMKAGLTGCHQHIVQDLRGNKLTFDTKDQPGADLQMFGFWEQSGVLTKLSVTHGATSIGAQSQNPERALELFNLIQTDKDFYMLLNYGILNKTYYLNEQGQLYKPLDFDDNKNGYYANFWGGRKDEFEPPSATEYPGYQAYSDSLDKIAVLLPFDGCVFDLTSVQGQVDAVQQVLTNELPPIAYGKVSDAAAAVNRLADDLKAAGVDAVTTVVQQQLDAWKAQQ